MGHYKRYTEHDFEILLERLVAIKGKFLLSAYPSEVLTKYIKQYNWHVRSFEKKIAVTKRTTKGKTEVLVANYPI